MCSDLLGAAILAAAPFVSSCPFLSNTNQRLSLLPFAFSYPSSVSSETGNHLILHDLSNDLPILSCDVGHLILYPSAHPPIRQRCWTSAAASQRHQRTHSSPPPTAAPCPATPVRPPWTCAAHTLCVCVCVCVCVCLCVYATSVCVYTYTHTRTHAHTRIYVTRSNHRRQ